MKRDIPTDEFASMDEYVQNLKHYDIKFKLSKSILPGGPTSVITKGKTVMYDKNGLFILRYLSPKNKKKHHLGFYVDE